MDMITKLNTNPLNLVCFLESKKKFLFLDRRCKAKDVLAFKKQSQKIYSLCTENELYFLADLTKRLEKAIEINDEKEISHLRFQIAQYIRMMKTYYSVRDQ